MIYIAGDIHGELELYKVENYFYKKNIRNPNRKTLRKKII